MATIPQPPKTIAVYVGLDRVGDGLLKLPFVRALRALFPDAHITWIAGRENSVYSGILAPLVDGLIDEVIDYASIGISAKEFFRRPLDGRKFDLVIDTQRGALAAFQMRRLCRGVFISPFARFLLSSKKPKAGYKRSKSMLRQMLDLLEIASGTTLETPTTLEVPLDAPITAMAEQLLPYGPTYVGLSPGAGGASKCWPLENYISLAQRLSADGRVPVFLLGPMEESWRQDIAAHVPGALFPVQSDKFDRKALLDPRITIALAKRLAAAVANDSGIGHMLSAGGMPLITLFGHTPPEKFRPLAADLTLIRATDYGSEDMSVIPVDAVANAVNAILSRP